MKLIKLVKEIKDHPDWHLPKVIFVILVMCLEAWLLHSAYVATGLLGLLIGVFEVIRCLEKEEECKYGNSDSKHDK